MSFYKIILRIIKKENIVESLQALRKERGAVFVLTALLLPVLFGFLGVGYDVGNLYMHRARLQNVADAAALAGGRAFMESQKKPSNKDAVDVLIDENGPTTPAKGAKEVTYKLSDKENDRKKKHNNSKHKDADLAADDYIYKNLGNLGTNVKGVIADKYSHYALDPSVGAVSPPSKTFYRIGLYEKVKLNFLPVLLGESVREQIVRAGAIVLVSPEETTIVHVGGSDSDDSGVINPSIFDNLFTFSEWLFTRNLTTAEGKILSSFTGNSVYTHLNNTEDSPSLLYYKDNLQPSSYFHYESSVGGINDEFPYTHMYQEAINSNVNSSGGTINDPTIDTFYDTKAYLEAFKKKLNGPHVDISDSAAEGTFVISGDKSIDVHCIPPRYKLNDTESFRKEGNTYYLLNEDATDATFQQGGKVYQICYHKFDSSDNYVRCGKLEGVYYMLTSNGNISICSMPVDNNDNNLESNYWKINVNGQEGALFYENSEFLYGLPPNVWYPKNSISEISLSLPMPVNGNNFNEISYYGTGTSNVYHILKRWLTDPNQIHTTVNIVINDPIPGDENEPVYVLVEGINQVKILGTAVTTRRPVIIVFLSEESTQIKYEFNGGFIGTIYAPISTFEHVKGMGTSFTGNIIARTINIQSTQEITWVQENHLEKYKYEYVEDEKGDYVLENGSYRKIVKGEDVTGTRYSKVIVYEYIPDNEEGDYVWENGSYRKIEKGEDVSGRQKYKKAPVYEYLDKDIKDVSDKIAKKIEEANKNVDLTEDLKMEIYHGLGLEDDEIEAMNKNPNWYNEQTFGRKKSLYQSWRSLYDTYKSDSNKSHLINLLWPWNEHFGIEEGEDKEEKIEESLRLINFRTEYRDASGIINPFIYLTLN